MLLFRHNKRGNKQLKRFSRKRKNGFINFGVMIFSFASIISTGFSTWSIVEVATASVNAGGDGVIALNDAISFFPPLYDFSFCQDGMVKDHVIVVSGNILVTAIIDNAKASKFVSNNKYKATIILEETSNTDLIAFHECR